MELIKATKEDFKKIYDEMTHSFPKEEIRDFCDALTAFEDPAYAVYHTVKNGTRIGFITLWSLEGFAFCEHFVTYEEYRSKGYGKEVLEKLKSLYPILVLECEPPVTEIAARRLKFYERCGFIKNRNGYIQPSYRPGGDGVPLVIMSYPCELGDFHGAVKKIYSTVYKLG
jgi:GNAT superfamily N-acetyltransferase